ncbi:24447_t:CDS:1, partial [Cetraspora pellucida]
QKDTKIPTPIPTYDSKRIPRYQHQHMIAKKCQDTNTNIQQQKDTKIPTPTPTYNSIRIPRYQHQHQHTIAKEYQDINTNTNI